MRIAIVDDEELARKLLREYLSAYEDVEVVAECANGFEAVKAVTDLKPDLLLLDIQMPRLNGFEVLELIGREAGVIFVTAYDQYALRAFDVHAVDYLLKPVSEERLREALERARSRLASKSAAVVPTQLSALARPAGAHLERVAIRLPVQDVVPDRDHRSVDRRIDIRPFRGADVERPRARAFAPAELVVGRSLPAASEEPTHHPGQNALVRLPAYRLERHRVPVRPVVAERRHRPL